MGLVAQAGITAFLDWFGGDQAQPAVTADVFGTAPRELTRSISLAQTLDLVRTVIDVVEREIAGLAAPGEGDLAREAVLRYSREVAFSAAEVYAQAAEARGAWDARLESLVVDAVLRGEADESMQSRAAALGWGAVTQVVVVVGSTPPGATAPVLTDLHRAARRAGVELLVAHPRRRGSSASAAASPTRWRWRRRSTRTSATGRWSSAPSSRTCSRPAAAPGPPSPGTARRRPGRPAPRPVHADDLLAERALLGDLPARGALVARIVRPLAESPGGTLLETAAAFLDGAQGVEGTARTLFVHPNTVRYRLAGIAKTDRLRPHRRPRRADRAHRARVPPARTRLAVDHAALTGIRGPRSVWRKPTDRAGKVRPRSSRDWSRPAGQGGERARHRLPRPGLPDPGLPRPVARAARPARPADALSDAAEVDLVAHGTTSDEDTIKDTAVAQPLLVGAGLLALRALPARTADGAVRRGRRPAPGRSPGTRSARSPPPPRPGCSPRPTPCASSPSAAGRWRRPARPPPPA